MVNEYHVVMFKQLVTKIFELAEKMPRLGINPYLIFTLKDDALRKTLSFLKRKDIEK